MLRCRSRLDRLIGAAFRPKLIYQGALMSHFLTRQDLARLAAFRQQLRGRRFRGLLWVSEAPDRARGVARECLAQRGWSAPLWVGEAAIR